MKTFKVKFVFVISRPNDINTLKYYDIIYNMQSIMGDKVKNFKFASRSAEILQKLNFALKVF